MKVIFLDFDGVINSHQSCTFWHNKRDQSKWENEMYSSWQGTLFEYLAHEFCPIALSNVEELFRRVPDLKIVVSSTWRLGNTVEDLQKILSGAPLVAAAVIDTTPAFRDGPRGNEIQDWLSRHPEVAEYAIIDDDSDMLESQQERFVHTSSLHGFQYGDMLHTLRILKEGGNHG
ncbi:MAG: hypothetical protein HC840_00580 [Leptolyngbyaceae cyanobacterium RM2_2_4]|nr:hypothetical protein [Leptolyngbyaceae cyanobacterium RM2_2_4]